MNETDTRAKLIDPMLRAAGWDETRIRREVVVGSRRVDYVLYDGGRVVAVVEAKAATRPARDGLAQAVDYAQRLGAAVAMATNGREVLVCVGNETIRRTTLASPAQVRELCALANPAQARGAAWVPYPSSPKPRKPANWSPLASGLAWMAVAMVAVALIGGVIELVAGM